MHVKYALLSSPHTIEFLETRLLLNVFRTQKILHQLTIQETLYHVSVSTYSSLKKKNHIREHKTPRSDAVSKFWFWKMQHPEWWANWASTSSKQNPSQISQGSFKRARITLLRKAGSVGAILSNGGWHVVKNQALESNKLGFRSQLHPLPSYNIK